MGDYTEVEGFPGCPSGKESTYNAGDMKKCGFDP